MRCFCGTPSLTILVSRAHCRLVCSFPGLHFNFTKMSLASSTEIQEALSFAYRSRKMCMWISTVFVTDFLSLLGEFLTMHCNNVKKQCPREKVWSVVFYRNLLFNSEWLGILWYSQTADEKTVQQTNHDKITPPPPHPSPHLPQRNLSSFFFFFF